MKKFLTALFGGAALAYFFDPDHGTRRRHITKDRATSLFRRVARRSAKKAEYIGGQVQGLTRTTASYQPDNPNPDDKTLKDRVESEVLREHKFKVAPINFNVEDGVVVVRGELDSQADIDELVSRVRSIRNVKGVESYLHLPGTPAPNKEEALRVS